MVEIVFEEPPRAKRGQPVSSTTEEEFVRALRNNPGEWAILPTGDEPRAQLSQSSAWAKRTRIIAGRGAFRGGDYEAVTRKVDDGAHSEPYWRVYVRFQPSSH